MKQYLTLKDVIDTLAQVDLVHIKIPPKEKVLGYYVPLKQRIEIEVNEELFTKRLTLIHELIHAKYDLTGIVKSEAEVMKEGSETFKSIYRIKKIKKKEIISNKFDSCPKHNYNSMYFSEGQPYCVACLEENHG